MKTTAILYIASTSVIVVLAVVACAGTEQYLRAQPSTHFPTGESLELPTGLDRLMTLHCLMSSKIKYEDTTNNGGSSSGSPMTEKECLYISADVGHLPSAQVDKPTRNQVIDTLVSISDINCSTFLHRAFANRAGLDYTKTLLQDLATAASAGTAAVSAPVSAGLSGTNLLVGKSIDTFNATYYLQQTFQAMESAIDSSRQSVRAQILSREAYEVPGKIPSDLGSSSGATAEHASSSGSSPSSSSSSSGGSSSGSSSGATNSQTYSLSEALADIRDYDDACSIKGGLAKLNAVATTSQKAAHKCVASVQSADTTQQKTTQANSCANEQ
jgi:hypothetical protein